ncbi:heterokaryon incompatibility protein-domain-containing protein [Xylaria castorea]|nr:heterokaryon incompatibility protein-domain-containing protein [Xylaria castorea]
MQLLGLPTPWRLPRSVWPTCHLQPWLGSRSRASFRAWPQNHSVSYGTSSIYSRLDESKHEIRVLRIKPGFGDDPLSCSLKTVSLDWRPRYRYDTLSYHWGTSTTRVPISVNNCTMPITPSLFDALRSLRQPYRTVTLWADALCINQDDTREKSTQVPLMGRIYGQGRQTWISLGSPDEVWATGKWRPRPKIEESWGVAKRWIRGAWRVFWHHLILRRSRQVRLGVNHVSDTVRLFKSLESKREITGMRLEDKKIARSMLSWLILHPYWTRVWVMQEVSLSSRDPICVFGRYKIPLLSLDSVLSDLRGGWDGKDSSLVIANGWNPDINDGLDRCVELCLLRDEWRRQRKFDLERCLQFGSHRHTSVAHDHVYGLYNILSPESQRQFSPNYDISIRDLYSHITKMVLQTKHSASALCAAVGIRTDNEHGLPSWCIDQSKPILFPDESCASSNMGGADTQKTSRSSTLQLQGKLLGRVARVSLSRVPDGLAGGDTFELEHEALALFLHLRTFTSNVDPRLELQDFISIVTDEVYKRSEDRRLTQIEDVVSSRMGERLDKFSALENIPEKLSPTNHLPLTEVLVKLALSFLKTRIGLPGRNDVLFESSLNRIGKCSGDVQSGDEIWLLRGSNIPFVLRPLEGKDDINEGVYNSDPSISAEAMKTKYRLVGPCKISRFSLREHELDQEETVELI